MSAKRTIRLVIPESYLRDVLRSAVEGGVYGAGWLRNYDSEVIGDYRALGIGDPHPDGEAVDLPVRKSIVTLRDVLNGVQRAFDSENDYHSSCAYRVFIGESDATDCDIILQYAVYGEVVWG